MESLGRVTNRITFDESIIECFNLKNSISNEWDCDYLLLSGQNVSNILNIFIILRCENLGISHQYCFFILKKTTGTFIERMKSLLWLGPSFPLGPLGKCQGPLVPAISASDNWYCDQYNICFVGSFGCIHVYSQ